MPTIDELADASTVAGTDRIIIQQATNESSKKATVSQLNLDNLGFTPTDGNILVGDGTNFVEESGATARTSLGVDAAGTDNSTDVTLAGTPDYITLSGQVLTRNQVDLTADVTGDLPVTEGGTGVSSLTNGGVLLGSGTGAVTAMAVLADGEMIVGDGTTDPVAESGATLRTSIGVDAAGTDNSTDVTLTGTPDYITISGQVITRGSIDLTSDVTGDLPVAEGGTGGSTATAGFDNLSPVTTKGDIVARNSSNNTRLGVGSDNHVLTADSGEATGMKWAAVTSSPTVGVGSYSGLVVLRASATTVDIDADGVVLTDGTNTYQASSVNLTADITASGANGLDTGSEATTTWYYAYVIYNGTTVSSLLSVSATSPTMPSGYTYKKRVGAVYNDGGGDIEQSRQYGNVSFFDIQQTAFLSGGSAASFTQLTPSPLPTTAFQAYVFMEFGKFDAHLSIDGTNIMSAIGDGSDNHQGNQLVPLDTSRQFYYKKRGGSESGNMSVAGWIDNI
jgi:hypothetical protein